MKVTQDFLDKLDKLSRITLGSVYLTEGNLQSVKQTDKIFATVELKTPLPNDAGIKDIRHLINTMKLFNLEDTKNDCNIEANPHSWKIASNTQKINYNLVKKEFIQKSIPSKDVKSLIETGILGDSLIEFDLSAEVLSSITDTIKVLGVDHVALNVGDGILRATIQTYGNSGYNSSEIVLGKIDCPDLNYVFDSSVFMMIPNDNYVLSLYSDKPSTSLIGEDFSIFLGANVDNTVKVS